MSEIQISEPKKEDARATIEVQYETWLATYPNDVVGITLEDIKDRYKDAFTEEGIQRREKLITNPEPTTKVLVAKDGDKLIGICCGLIEETRNYLQMIYILPGYQGQGIGTKFWNELLSFFDACKDIYVDVADYNDKAIGFYKKLGFVDTGKRFSEERFRMKSGAIISEMEMVLKRV